MLVLLKIEAKEIMVLTALYYTALYCTALHCTALSVLHCTQLHCKAVLASCVDTWREAQSPTLNCRRRKGMMVRTKTALLEPGSVWELPWLPDRPVELPVSLMVRDSLAL